MNRKFIQIVTQLSLINFTGRFSQSKKPERIQSKCLLEDFSTQVRTQGVFLARDAVELCSEHPTRDLMFRLFRIIDCLSLLSQIPGIAQQFIKKGGQDITVMLQTLSMKVKLWPQQQGRLQLTQSITRFYQALILVPDLKVEIARNQLEAKAKEEVPRLQFLQFMASVFQNSETDSSQVEVGLRCLRLKVLYYQHRRKDGARIPQFMNFKQTKKLEEFGSQWERLLDSLIVTLQQYSDNQQLSDRVLDLLIILTNLSDMLRNQLVSCGVFRTLISQIDDEKISEASTKQCLVLMRDLCSNDPATTELMSRHETENHLLRVMQRFHSSTEICFLISVVLERLISGCDLDLENFENNIRSTTERLKKYVELPKGSEDISQTLYNMEVVRFYSLMQTFTRRMVGMEMDDLFLNIVKKEVENDSKELEVWATQHDRLLTSSITVLNNMLQLPETSSSSGNSGGNNSMGSSTKGPNSSSGRDDQQIKSRIQKKLTPCLFNVIQTKTDRKDVVCTAIQSYQVLFSLDITRKDATQIAIQENLTESLLEISDIYKNDIKLTQSINNLFYTMAQNSKEAANRLSDMKIVTSVLKQMKDNLGKRPAPPSATSGQQNPGGAKDNYMSVVSDTMKNYIENRKRNLEYMNTFSQIPTTAQKIVEGEGLKCIEDFIKEENKNKETEGLQHLSDENTIDEHLYDLNMNLGEAVDFDDPSKRKIQSSDEDPTTRETNVLQILRKLLTNANDGEQFISDNLVSEVLQYLRLHAVDREICVSSLRLISRCVEDDNLLDIISKHQGVESVFIALNCHPTDKDVIQLAGNILTRLDAESLARGVQEQYESLGTECDPSNPDALEAIRQANIYLGNLLTAAPPDQSQEMLNENEVVVQTLEKIIQKESPPNFLASILLLISRLANSGDETRKLIRMSDIPLQIINYIILDSRMMDPHETGRLSEFAIEALYGMIGGTQDLLAILNPNTGDEINNQSDETLLEYLFPLDQLLVQFEGKPLERIMELLDLSVSNLSAIQKCSTFLARCCECEGSIAVKLLQKKCDVKVNKIFEEMLSEERNQPVKLNTFKTCGRLKAALGRASPEQFNKVCVEKNLNAVSDSLLNIRVSSDLINNIPHLEAMRSFFAFLKTLLSNKFDKSNFIGHNVCSSMVKLVQRLSELPVQDFKNSTYLCIAYRQALGVLIVMLEDPIIAHDLSQYEFISHILKFLWKYIEDKPDDFPEGVIKSGDVIGQASTLQRTLETCFKLLDILMRQHQYATFLGKIYTPDNVLTYLPCVIYNGPYINVQMLKILKFCMICYDEDEKDEDCIIDRNKFTGDIGLVKEYCTEQYVNVPIIQKISEELIQINKAVQSFDKAQLLDLKKDIFPEYMQKQLLISQINSLNIKSQEYAQQKIQENMASVQQEPTQRLEEQDEDEEEGKDMEIQTSDHSSDMIMKLDRIAGVLELFFNDIEAMQGNEDQDQMLQKVLETIRTFTTDDNTAQKVHHLGITDALLNIILISNQLKPTLTADLSLTLAHVAQFLKALKQYEQEIDFIEPLIIFLQFISQSNLSLSATEQIMTKYEITAINMLECLKCLCSIDSYIDRFLDEKGSDIIINVFKQAGNHVEIIIKCAEIIDKLSYNEQIALETTAEKTLDNIQEYYKLYNQNINFLRSFSLLLGTICRASNAQTKLGELNFHIHLIEGLRNIPQDIVLATNSFYALSGLAYNNKNNCDLIMKTDILNFTKKYISNFTDQFQVVETICSLYSNLTFKNENNQKRLGEDGIMDSLHKLFEFYSDLPEINIQTLKQILRAMGNSSLTIENTTRIVKNSFIPTSYKLIEKMKYKEEGDVLRYCLDVISNLSSHPDDLNRINTETMLKQGVLDIITNCLRKNMLISDIVASAIDALDGLIQNKLVSVVVAEKDTIDLILKIMKSQDWNDTVILKCSRVLANISHLQQNIDQLLKYSLPLTLADILQNQKKPNDRIINYSFKILNRIAQEKNQEKAIIHSGVIEALGVALSHRGISPENVFNLITLLKSLSKINEAIDLICKKAVCVVIDRTVDQKNNPDIVKNTLVLLQRLMIVPESGTYVSNGNGIQFLITILRIYISHEEILELSMKCIKALCNCGETFRLQLLNSEAEHMITQLTQTMKPGSALQHTNAALFTLFNQKSDVQNSTNKSRAKTMALVGSKPEFSKDAMQFLTTGFEVKLYREDGSFKKANVIVSQDLKYLSGSQKGGAVQDQYNIPLGQISDYKFNYSATNQTWDLSVFSRAGGVFTKKPEPGNCVSIYGPITSENIQSINFQCLDMQTKESFHQYFLELLEYKQV